MNRDEFLAQLVAALQENGEGPAPPASSSPHSSSQASSPPLSPADGAVTGLFRERWRTDVDDADVDVDVDAREAHARLQFDFPQLTDAQLRALAALYRRAAQAETGGDADAQVLPVTNALVVGVAFLSEQTGDGAEARGLLAAALLLLLPARCLKSADQVRTRALLSRVTVPPVPSSAPATAPVPAAALAADYASDVFEEKFAAEEDPDDLSLVYEGSAPATGRFAAPPPSALSAMATGAGSGAFADKLQFLASRTFSSSFLGISGEKWEKWALDRCLADIVRHLLLPESPPQPPQRLYGHPHGEWTRYLYILRDRVLRFPNASRGGIQALKGLVELLQPAAASRHALQQTRRQPAALAVGRGDETGVEIQLPHHLVYRVLAELALSKELQQRSSQPAQRELAAALHALVPLIVQEIQRVGALRSAAAATGSGALEPRDALPADENDDLVLILTQLVHFLLFASPNKRVTADKLQESGVLRALLALVPADLSATHATMTAKRFWFTPLVRLVAECALWNVECAEFVVRVPKFVALLPAMREQFPAELSLLLVAFYHHELQSAAPIQALVRHELDNGSTTSNSSSRQLWDAFVSRSLFPLSCASYLDSMAKLQDAIYLLECVVEALEVIRVQLVGDLRASLQCIYPSFSRAFVYPSFSTASAEPTQETAAAEKQIIHGDSDGDIDGDAESQEREERGTAESLQFIALRNKLRQCTKTVLLTSSSGGGIAASSSKLD